MKYYVGDVARLLGITPSALRFYEEEKIIYTKKTSSGRRYYDLGDIARLLSYKKYTSMGISLKEVEGQFAEQGDSREIIGKRVWRKVTEAREKADYYRVLADIIESHARAIEDIDGLLGKYTVFSRPACYLLSDPYGQLMSADPQTMDCMARWVQGMPATRYAFWLEKENFRRGSAPSLGYVVPADQAEALHLPLDAPGVQALEETPCLRSIAAVDNSFNVPKTVFDDMGAYMAKKRFKAAGTSIAVLILVESIRNNHYRSYLDLTVPISL